MLILVDLDDQPSCLPDGIEGQSARTAGLGADVPERPGVGLLVLRLLTKELTDESNHVVLNRSHAEQPSVDR